MKEIKSKKAKSFIDDNMSMNRRTFAVADIEYCVVIAEQEAEERHAKELQELKDKITNLSICDIDAPVFTHTIEFRSHFDYIKKWFIQKLTEKQ